ncbi:MAG: hypothetical protein OQJ97_07850 [Rhodospirillales bacterium]|nr:hypothetical protein [Rhodospirillales bacterium]
MTSSNNLLPQESGQRLSFDDILNLISNDIAENNWEQVDQTCTSILAEANGNLDQVPFSDLKYIQALAKFTDQFIVEATELALEAFEADSNNSETPELLAILFALLGDLNKSLFYSKMAAAFPSREELKQLLPTTLPTLANSFLKVEEKPLLGRGILSATNHEWYAAIHWFQQQIQYEPENKEGYTALASVFSVLGRFREALDTLRSYAHTATADPEVLSSIGTLLTSLGEFESARNCHYLATKAAPDDIELHAAALTDTFSTPNLDSKAIAKKCNDWMKRFAPELGSDNFSVDFDKDKLTVGFIIGPFNRRNPSYPFAEILAYRDDEKYNTVGFGYGALADGSNTHLQKAFDIWHDTKDMDPYTLSSMIEAEEVDILVDMCGFDTPHLARIFGSRVAPVQVSWRGTPYGSGSETVDYRISDAYSEEGIDPSLYQEQVVHLSGSSQLVSTPKLLDIEKVNDPDTPLTFGADVSFSQLTGKTIRAWVEILLNAPNSQLALWDHNFSYPENTQKLIGLFGCYGLAHRIDILNVGDKAAFYANIDVLLYPLAPENQDISLDPIQNGIPAVCLKGDNFLERGMANVLTEIAVGENCVATNQDDYVKLALEWTNEETRSDFSEKMRGKIIDSSLFNYKERAKELDRTFEHLWKEAAQKS